MKKQEHKKVVETFSIPADVSQELHIYVKRSAMNHFFSDAIRKELMLKKEGLRKAYAAANKDEGQKEAMAEWENTTGDGIDR